MIGEASNRLRGRAEKGDGKTVQPPRWAWAESQEDVSRGVVNVVDADIQYLILCPLGLQRIGGANMAN